MRRIILCMLLLLSACGGEEKKEVEIYDILGIWEVSPTINCREYDCYEKDCLEADIPSKYSMTIEYLESETIVLFHYNGIVEGPYLLKNKVDNTYTIYEFQDKEFYIEIYELTITLNSDDLFVGEESWRTINNDGYCKKNNSLVGERKTY